MQYVSKASLKIAIPSERSCLQRDVEITYYMQFQLLLSISDVKSVLKTVECRHGFV